MDSLMRWLRAGLCAAGALALLAIAAAAGVLAYQGATVPGVILRTLDARIATLQAELRGARLDLGITQRDIVQLVDRHLGAAGRDLAAQLARANDSIAQVAATVATVPGEIRPAVTATTAALEQSRAALEQARATMRDLQDTADDLFPDVRAAVQSGTVAARGVAESAEAVGKAAPALTEHVEKFTGQTAGIATDVHTATSAFVAPKRWTSKVWDALKLGVYGAARAF